MKKVFKGGLVLVIVLSAFLTACSQKSGTSASVTPAQKPAASESSRSAEKKKQVVIGFSVGTMKQERWQREVKMAQKYADDHGFKLIVQSCEEDATKQIQQVEGMLTQGIDALLISAQDSESSGVIVEKAHQAGVKVVAYDRLVRNGDLDYYITFDNVKVGELEAKMLTDRYPKGNYIWVLGGPEDNNAHLLKQGQETILKPYIDKGDIKIVVQQWAKNWNPEEALKIAENGLTKAKNDVVAVVASNDGTAGGVIQALEAQGLAGKVGVSGQDAEIAALQRIVEGKQTGTVYKPTQVLNQTAMDLVYALAVKDEAKIKALESGNFKNGTIGKVNNGTKDVLSLLMDVQSVTKENIVDTVVKDEFQKMEDIYKNVPKDQWPKTKS